MASLKTIVSYLDRLFATPPVKDGSWNGLQIEGGTTVRKILFAVDAGAATFEKAVDEHADLIVAHHGLFWSYANPSYCGVMKKRIDILSEKNISLYAAHLPLDLHKSLGNNAGIISLVGARIADNFISYEGTPLSYTGRFKKPVTLNAMAKKLNAALRTECSLLPFGPKKIKTVGVLSGSCSHAHLDEAIQRNLDCFVTGEQIDVYHLAKDAGINVIFAGHHATETVGIKALCDFVKKKLKVKTIFVDIPTGL